MSIKAIITGATGMVGEGVLLVQFPSPLWGGVRVGVVASLAAEVPRWTPLPTLPHKGGGNGLAHSRDYTNLNSSRSRIHH
jgi:hypothetical protein